jgi:hypothetical protein
MAFAQGSRTRLSYVVENSFGATPSSPGMLEIPYTQHSINLQKQRVQGNDIQSDRIPRVDRHGTRQVTGDLQVDLRPDDYDDFIESAFFATFGTTGAGSITPGTTPQYLTIEDAALDITQFRQFVGCAVSQMSINLAPDQMVQTTFSLVGQDMTQAQSSLGSPTAPSGNEPFDSFNGTIQEGGSDIAIISSAQFSINNSLSNNFVVGSNIGQSQLSFGRAVVEGQITAYYEDNTLIDKFLDETESSLSFEVNNTTSGGSYTFLLPNVKYNGGDVPVQDPQSRLITLPFVAIYDSGESTNLKLTKA